MERSSSDVLQLLCRDLNTKLELRRQATEQQGKQKGKRKNLKILPLTVKQPEKNHYFKFSSHVIQTANGRDDQNSYLRT